MIARLLYFSELIDRFIDKVGRGVSWLTLVLVVIICIDVLLRYFFNVSKNWVNELEWQLFSVLFLIGGSYALLHDKHVRVDLFYENFSDRLKDRINAIGVIIFLIPWCAIVIYYGYHYTLNSWAFKEGSPNPGGIPARYIIKSFIFFGFVLLLLQGLSILIKSIFKPQQD